MVRVRNPKDIWVRVRILDTRIMKRDIPSCGSSLPCGNPPASPLPDKLKSSEGYMGYMGYLYGIYGIYIYQINGLVVPSSLLCGNPPASPLADKPQSFSSELPYILPASQPCLSSSSEICKDNAHIHQNDDQYSEITKSTN